MWAEAEVDPDSLDALKSVSYRCIEISSVLASPVPLTLLLRRKT